MFAVTCRALLPPDCASWASDALLLEAALSEEAASLGFEDAGDARGPPALSEASLLGAMAAEAQVADWKGQLEDAWAKQLPMHISPYEKSLRDGHAVDLHGLEAHVPGLARV